MNSIGSVLAVQQQQQSKKKASTSKRITNLRFLMAISTRAESVVSEGSIALNTS